MDVLILINAGINYEAGLKRFCGISSVYEDFLKKFVSENLFSTLKKAVEEGNLDKAHKTAHILKGMAGNLSMDILYDSLYEFVELLKVGKIDIKLFNEISDIYDKTVNAITENK